MPKRKKLPAVPDYKGIGKNSEKMMIQKSNPLTSLSETDMTLPELKILDAYLARINSHEPDKRYVQFEKGELEKLLGVTRILKDDLDKRIDNLFQTITIQDETKRRGFTKIALFEKAECDQDENGLWQVNLTCTNAAMEYIFNIENIGYLKYRLRNIINFTSRYSYFLYLYIEDNLWKKQWKVNVDELKQILDCKSETYNEFRRFNDLVLKKAQKDILKHTDVSYIYSTIKNGRKVVAIQFEVERKTRTELIVESTKMDTEPPKREAMATVAPELQQSEQPLQELPSKPCGFHSFETDFTPEEIQALTMIINAKLSVPDTELADKILHAKYAECKLTCPDAEKPFAYFIAAITKMSVEEFERKKPENNDGFDADEYNIFLNNF